MFGREAAELRGRVEALENELEGLRRYEKQTVLLHTKDGQSFRGVLTQYEDCAVLSHNVATWNGEQEVTLGGEVVVACPNISFFQTIPPKA